LNAVVLHKEEEKRGQGKDRAKKREESRTVNLPERERERERERENKRVCVTSLTASQVSNFFWLSSRFCTVDSRFTSSS
jgi:hypothetical protein